MKAVVLSRNGTVELCDLPDAQVKSPQDVLVRVDALSICETDEKIVDKLIPVKKLPISMGHEASGVVVEVGNKVENVSPGDRVLIDPNLYDETCSMCRLGFSQLCLNGGLMGRDVEGVFQQLLAIPCRNVYTLPKKIPALVGPLLQPLSTVIHGHRQINLAAGDVVVVWGMGVAGSMMAQVAKLRGALVIGVSRSPAKLELAKKMGVDIVINSLQADPVKEVMSATDGRGADIVIEAAGAPDLISKGIHMLRPRGTLLQFGSSSKEVVYNMYDTYFKELTLKASRSSLPVDFHQAIRIVDQGRIDLNYLISKVFKFEETKDAFDLFRDRTRTLKVVITN